MVNLKIGRSQSILPLGRGLLARDSNRELFDTGRNPNDPAPKGFVKLGRTRFGQLLLQTQEPMALSGQGGGELNRLA